MDTHDARRAKIAAGRVGPVEKPAKAPVKKKPATKK
jgi:hypothetical protein